MRPQYDIFLPGDYFFDMIYTGLRQFPVLGAEVYSQGLIATGGAMFITAVALRRLGVRAGWAACFGNDYYSDYVHRLAREADLDLTLAVRVDQPYRRVTTSIPYQGERAFVTYVDPPPIDIEAHWRRGMAASDFKHLHLGGLLSIKRLGPLSEIARAQGATISMDCQDNPDLKNVCDWPELLALVDVFMPNAREAMLITGLSTVQGAVEQLAAWIDPIIVKDGANGVWIGHDGDVIHVRAIDAGPVIDTTGAGDCFNAGFLYGWVVERAPLSQAAVYGNICGGLSVTQVGGATAAPTRAELLDWYARLSGGADAGSERQP